VKTIEERIEASDRRVEECEARVEELEDDLAAAQEDLEEAEEEALALEEEAEAPKRAAEAAALAHLIADRDGPMRPVGDRQIRIVCGIDEIPQVYADRMRDSKLRCIVGSDGRKWATNYHWMICVDSVDGLGRSQSTAEGIIGPAGASVTREDKPIVDETNVAVRSFGSVVISLEYASLVEDLFPGVDWRHGGMLGHPLQAIVNGVVVAAVMPVRRPDDAA
jgi:hypothetical protein